MGTQKDKRENKLLEQPGSTAPRLPGFGTGIWQSKLRYHHSVEEYNTRHILTTIR